MDNNQVNTQAAPNIEPQVTNLATPPSGENKKMIIWLVGGLIIIVIIVLGIYLMLSSQKKESDVSSQTPAPVIKEIEDVSESEVEGINVSDIDNEMSALDKDIQSL